MKSDGSTGTGPLLDRLAEAVTVADGRQEPTRVDAARALLDRSRERLLRGPDHVVVALGGGTGSGTSSISNALVGRELSTVGVVRPTTERALGWSAGPVDPELVGWLGLLDHQIVPPRDDLPEGLVVVDLPDHDSVATHHRGIVDRAVEVVDILVFVVDPLKYAQRSLFDGYLRPLADHPEVVVVVLNRVDELDGAGRRACLDDLGRLLADVGLPGARVLPTSARTGEGVDELRALLAEEARSRRAVGERIRADVAVAADHLGADVQGGADLGDATPAVDALAEAADISGATRDAAAMYLSAGRAATRPPVTGVVTRTGARLARPLRRPLVRAVLPPRAPEPPERAAVDASSSGSGSSSVSVSVSGSETSSGSRSSPSASEASGSVPSPESPSPESPSVERSAAVPSRPTPPDARKPSSGPRRQATTVALRHALRTVTRPVADGLPLHWQQRLRGRVAHLVDRLPGRTRDALGVVALRAPSRWWWAVVAFLWTLVEIAIVVGAGWLTGLFVIAWLQLPDPPTPQLGTVPWPTVLVLAGVPLWLLFRGVRGLGLRRGARRHARRIRVRLRERVDEAVEAGLVDLRKEVDARDRLLELVSGLRRQ